MDCSTARCGTCSINCMDCSTARCGTCQWDCKDCSKPAPAPVLHAVEHASITAGTARCGTCQYNSGTAVLHAVEPAVLYQLHGLQCCTLWNIPVYLQRLHAMEHASINCMDCTLWNMPVYLQGLHAMEHASINCMDCTLWNMPVYLQGLQCCSKPAPTPCPLGRGGGGARLCLVPAITGLYVRGTF
ncbi:hypothetical protein ACOMHN_051032 [Nucella lapillus]